MSSSPSLAPSISDRLKFVLFPLAILSLLIIAVVEQSPRAPDAGFWAPGGIYGDHWDSVKYEPFSGGRWGISFSILLLGHFFLTHLIGYQMIRPWLSMSRVPFGIKLCAAFFPGYLALAGINRILNLVLPNSVAPTVCIVVPIVLCWLLSRNQSAQTEPLGRSLISYWKHLTVLAGVYILSILLHIHLGRIFMVSDSTGNTFLPVITQLIQRINEIRFFPLIDQQYDEFAFSYPLNFLPPGRNLLIVPYWWLASVGKVALCATFWVILFPIRQTPRLSLIPLVGAPFLVLSGLVPNPLKYIDLTGCMLPILDGWHIGRLLGPTLPFLVLGLFFEKTEEKPSLFRATLLGIGVGTTSIHNALFASGTVALAALWYHVKPLRIAPTLWRNLAIACSAITLSCIVYTYAAASASPSFYNGWLLILGAILSSVCIVLRPNLQSQQTEPTVPKTTGLAPWIVFLAGIVFSVSLLGNMPSTKIVESIRSVIPAKVLPGAYELAVKRAASLANIDAPKKYFYFAGNRSPSKHALSFQNFLGYYGLLIVVAITLLTLWALSPIGPSVHLSNPHHLQLLLFFSASLSLAFFCVDFILDGILPWIKYRLIEIPFIGIFLLLLRKLDEECLPKTHLTFAILIVIWTLPGFLLHEPIEQFVANVKYLLNFF